MKCPICRLLEMRVDRVQDEKIHYICKGCGKQEVVDIKELENDRQAEEE